MTERWPADPVHVARAVERLRQGSVIAFPTDTLYAVGARARDPVAVARLYHAKQRPTGQPMIWLVSGRDQVEPDALVTDAAADLMRRFWPGPLTIVLTARAHGDGRTIAVRAPDHQVALTLLRSLGEPIASLLGPVDYARVAQGFGARGVTVSQPDELAPAIRAAFASGQPTLIEVPIALRGPTD